MPFTEGGESYQNYMRFKDGPRSQLLKLREQKPHLFTEPVPISDEAIKSSELYRRILSQNTPANPLLNLDVGEQEDAVDVEKQSTAGSKLRSFLSRVRQSRVVQVSLSLGIRVFSSILVMCCFMLGGALGSSDFLLPYSIK